MSHTPGPWTADDSNLGGEVFVFADNGPDGAKLAAICTGLDSEPNARLIAAAPELMEALESVKAGYEDHGEIQHATWNKVLAAITRAKGD